MKELITEAEQAAKLTLVPRQFIQFANKKIIRFNTSYCSVQEITFIAELIELSHQELEEVSIDFCSSFKNDLYIENSTVFAENSKFYNLLHYSEEKFDSEMLNNEELATFERKKQLSPSHSDVFRPITDALLKYSDKMKELEVLTLINPPQEIEEINFPPNLQVLILLNIENLKYMLSEKLPNLEVLSLNYCDLEKNQDCFLEFLESNALLYEKSFKSNLMQYFGSCSRHIEFEEIMNSYTQQQLRCLSERLNCRGIELLDLENCNINEQLGYKLSSILQGDNFVESLILYGNSIDLTLHRSDYEEDLSESEENYVEEYLETTFSEQLEKKQNSALLRYLEQYSSQEAEKYELLELKEHFLVELMNSNHVIRNVIIDEESSPALLESMDLRCKSNQDELKNAILQEPKKIMIEGQEEELEEFISAQIHSRSCLVELYDIEDPIYEHRCHSCKPSASPSKKASKKVIRVPSLVPKERKTKPELPHRQKSQREVLSARTGSSNHISKNPSFRSAREPSRNESRLTTSPADSRAASVTLKSVSNITEIKPGSSARASALPTEISILPPRPKVSILSDEMSQISMKEMPPPINRDSSEQSEQLTAKQIETSQLIEEECNSKLEELLKPLQELQLPDLEEIQEVQEQSLLREQSSTSKMDESLNEKIVDMLYDVIIFNFNDDEMKAKQFFLKNQEKLLDFCACVVADIQSGVLQLKQVRTELFNYVEALI